MKNRSDWRIITSETNDSQLTIADLNLGNMSVTNDIEQVTESLIFMGILRPGMRFFYYDSEGSNDEVIWNESGFVNWA